MYKISFKTEESYLNFTKFLEKNNFKAAFTSSDRKKLIYSFREERVSSSVRALKAFIHKDYKKYYLRRLLRENFYFKEENDLRNIVRITEELMEEERPQLSKLIKYLHSEENISLLLKQTILREGELEFEPFLAWELSNYQRNLARYLEIAIDEYLLAKQYYVDIYNLKDIFERYRSGRKVIHLVLDNELTIYNDKMTPLLMLKNNRQTSLSQEHYESLHKNKQLIISLLQLNPKCLYVYTRMTNNLTVKILQDVFAEAIKILPLEHFNLIRSTIT